MIFRFCPVLYCIRRVPHCPCFIRDCGHIQPHESDYVDTGELSKSSHPNSKVRNRSAMDSESRKKRGDRVELIINYLQSAGNGESNPPELSGGDADESECVLQGDEPSDEHDRTSLQLEKLYKRKKRRLRRVEKYADESGDDEDFAMKKKKPRPKALIAVRRSELTSPAGRSLGDGNFFLSQSENSFNKHKVDEYIYQHCTDISGCFSVFIYFFDIF